MKRGDVYRYEPVMARAGQSTTRLIVSADAVNANDDDSRISDAAAHDLGPADHRLVERRSSRSSGFSNLDERAGVSHGGRVVQVQPQAMVDSRER